MSASCDHDYVFSDLCPDYALTAPGKANPLRCYWVCRTCDEHGVILFRCNHAEFEKLVRKFPRGSNEWSLVDYAEHWLAQRPQKGSPVSVATFSFDVIQDIAADLDAEAERRVEAKLIAHGERTAEFEMERREARRSDEVVYLIRNRHSGLVKIGTTSNLTRRIAALRLQGGLDLEVLGYLFGDRELERQLHQQWAHLRVRGEWFKPSPDLFAWASKTLEVWDAGIAA